MYPANPPPYETRLGPAAFGPRKGTEGIVWHTTEGGDFSRDAAHGTITWQLSNPGSYNAIIYDGGLVMTVAWRDASGGLATGQAPYWQPWRYPWLAELLSAPAYADPNAYLLNFAFSGKTADILAGRMPDNMLTTAAILVRWVEGRSWGADNLILTSHADWQANRSDPGAGTVEAILARYTELYDIPQAPTPPPPDYPALYVIEQAKVTELAGRLGELKRKVAAHAADVADD